MLKKYSLYFASIGDKLRIRLLFDIFESIDYHQFLKAKFLKTRIQNDLVLKYI